MYSKPAKSKKSKDWRTPVLRIVGGSAEIRNFLIRKLAVFVCIQFLEFLEPRPAHPGGVYWRREDSSPSDATLVDEWSRREGDAGESRVADEELR